ncbi:WD repeat domain 35 [Trypanosoma rangeli]|uniref:WD repeat domain 35 n=1 Tax=Trypanosoma rangeli TaxID=5698 RepID=A0A3R7KZ79_TRYRA|nr:WD repeat domain 35 [Trypanosoma rangeli]RNF04337.1 WD repeat domain 35 [Trypanosoma rangeli]|eukprot:RNF04337.1 WD repeat domain 35 [Trypanosoma rangeli]
MYVYFSKRVAVPASTVVTAIAWNEEQGWLACGGKGGLLKVLKIDNGAGTKGALSMNQTLEGHSADVRVVAWNHQYGKLASSDEGGQIIVWALHKGMWMEEMINNRNKGTVSDLAWNTEGTKICIIYADGAVIVGGVDGTRIWGKDIKNELVKVTWSPDDRCILFGTKTGEILVHDGDCGHMVCRVQETSMEGEAPLTGLSWHPAWVDSPEPLATLVICFANGKMQLMREIGDNHPYLIDSGIPVSSVAWNPQGTIFVVCGVMSTAAMLGEASPSSSSSSTVSAQFFNTEGIHLRTLRVNGSHCGGVTWEGDGLRVCVAVDAALYFANVRPTHNYAYFAKTVVFAFHRPDRAEQGVMFWNTRSNERVIRYFRGLFYIDACKDACMIVNSSGDGRHRVIQLLNAIGGPLETRMIEMEPLACGMNSENIVLADEENIYVWQFRDPGVVLDLLDPISVQASRHDTRERVVHVDDIVRPDTPPSLLSHTAVTNDLVCSLCLSEDFLFVVRESGLLQLYRLAPLELVGKMILPFRVQSMAANSNSTRLSVCDVGGTMTLFYIDLTNLSLVPKKVSPQPNFERKDVWSMRWSKDDPELLVVMEKSRMYIFRGIEAEEPVQSCAYICKFKSFKVRALQLDEIMQDPERPRKEHVIDFETRELREARQAVEIMSMQEAYTYVEKHPHPKLWALLAEHALAKLDFDHAEMAVVRSGNYPAIQFVKRVKMLDDPQKQRAEIHTYYGRFDEAEKIYKDIDRKDLMLDLRYRLGDWFRVVQLVQEGGGDESHMRQAWENIGDYYADRQKWTKASQYYTQCRQLHKLAHILFLLEDYDFLAQLIPSAEHDKGLLLKIGEMLFSVGLSEDASRAFLAAGEAQLAVAGCVQLHQWDNAVAIAEAHKLKDILPQLARHTKSLIENERLPEAIELYRKAGQHDEAARLLARLGRRAAATDPLRAKKFYVLSALEIEKYRRKRATLSGDGTAAVDMLLSEERAATSERVLDAAWRGAEAFHFFLLCQQHILHRNLPYALNVAMRLMEYDDLISPVDSYRLIALTAYLAKNFSICSKAFTRLEAAEQMDVQKQNEEDGGGPAVAGQLQLIDMTVDLDVSSRTFAAQRSRVAMTGLAGAVSTGISGTTTSLQLTNPSKGVVPATQFTYPTVSLKEPRRRFADLAVKIFTKYKPEDNSADRVKCPKCDTFNKEWASACAHCQHPFGICIFTGRCITTEDFWQCAVCHHRIIEVEGDRFRNCPLCHTPIKHRARS